MTKEQSRGKRDAADRAEQERHWQQPSAEEVADLIKKQEADIKAREEKNFRDGCAVSAMRALTGMLESWAGDPEQPEATFAQWVASNAFEMADAMVAEKRRRDEA